MDISVASIIVAVITTLGGILVALIQQFRKENRQDHAIVVESLRHIFKSINQVDEKLNGHIASHGTDNGRVAKRVKEDSKKVRK